MERISSRKIEAHFLNTFIAVELRLFSLILNNSVNNGKEDFSK